MHPDKARKRSGRKNREPRKNVPDHVVLLIVCGAILLSVIFIAALVFTAPP